MELRQVRPVPPDRQVPLVRCRPCLVQQARQGLQVRLDRSARLARLVQLAQRPWFLALRARLEHQDQPAQLVRCLARSVPQEALVHKVHSARRALLDRCQLSPGLLARQGRQELPAGQVRLGQLVLSASSGIPARLVHQEQQVQQARQEHLALQGRPVRLDGPARQARQVFKARQARQERLEQQARPEQLVLRDRQARQARRLQ